MSTELVTIDRYDAEQFSEPDTVGGKAHGVHQRVSFVMSSNLLIEPVPPGATELRVSEARQPEWSPLNIHLFKGQFDPGSRKTPMRFRISMKARLKHCLEFIEHVPEDSIDQGLFVGEVMEQTTLGHASGGGHGFHAYTGQAMLEGKTSRARDKLEANKIRIFLAAVRLCHSRNIPDGMFDRKKILQVLKRLHCAPQTVANLILLI